MTRLEDGLNKRLTFISAPAGFGKTTLAAQWLDSIPGHSAWLSLDKNDNSPDVFLKYVIAALRSVLPGVCQGVESLLTSPTLPPPDYLADIMVSELSRIHDPVLLVLDDYHAITSELVQAIVIRMLEHLPEKLHMVVISRMDPPWPLALWRVRQWLNEMRAADLRVSLEEARTFFAQGLEKPLAPGTVEMLQERIEGWMAGLQLALLSLTDAEDPDQRARDFSHSDRLVVDFLMDEVISHQPPEILNFLAVTAMFNSFCAPLADFVMSDQHPSPDGRRIIERLETQNLFIVPLDRVRHWYRYHHLFQSLVVQHLNTVLSPERKALIHRRAAEWFMQQGSIEEAMQQFLSAGAVDDAAFLFQEHMPTAIGDDLSYRTLGRWLGLFPESVHEQNPAMLVAKVFEKMMVWDLPAIARLLDKAQLLLDDPGFNISEARRQWLQADIDAQRCFLLYWRGDAEEALRHSLQALPKVPPSHREAYNMTLQYVAGSYAVTGQRDEALRLLKIAIREDCEASSHGAGKLLVALTVIHNYGGNLDAVWESAERILSIHETSPVPDFWRGYAHYFLGCVAYERNLLDSAAIHFTRVEELRYRVNRYLNQDILLCLARVANASGDVERANEYVAAGRKMAISMKDPLGIQLYGFFEARLAAFSGKSRNAVLDAGPPPLDISKFWLEIPSMIRAEYLVHGISQVELKDGLQAVEDGLQSAKRLHNTRQTIQFMALEAVALERAGGRDEALEVLREALRLAEPMGFVRTFVDRGPLMAELLRVLLKRFPQDHYVRHLLEEFDDGKPLTALNMSSPKESYAHTPGTESLETEDFNLLTCREIEILNMLAERLSNKEIADRLFISVETVKSHARNIYSKLNVVGRRHAVDAAKKLGVLSEK
jgi:LuxR family maltose regulon positive regulatory protein